MSKEHLHIKQRSIYSLRLLRCPQQRDNREFHSSCFHGYRNLPYFCGSCLFNPYFFLVMASGRNIFLSNLPCIDLKYIFPTKFGSLWPDVVFQPRFLRRNRHDNLGNQVSFDTSPLFLLLNFVCSTIWRLSASLTRNSIGFEVF